ncbi:MAG: IclR family transcriptional regulator [Geodermatophilaceae bacterium]|nr:IclR family transcriptional regulator [Geodermatophilaceae bacterium]
MAGRALAVLGCFDTAHPRLTLSEISRRTALPLTTAHRQVAELTRWGALERDTEGEYRIGLRLWEVGSLAPRRTDLREAALPFLTDLYEITHENVQLAVLDGPDVVFLERISGRQAVHVLTRPGMRLPAHATAVGLVLLAHADDEAVEAVLAMSLRRFTRHTVTEPRMLRARLVEVRRSGFAVCERQIEEVSSSVAAPVLDASRVVVAALSLVVPADGGHAYRYLPAVQASARALSRQLGLVR